MLNMNKWSKSLPSINIPTSPTPDDDNDSHTDVSIIIQTKSSSKNYNTFVDTKPNLTKYDQFIPDDQLFQSLIAYANSFSLNETIYSINDIKNPLESVKLRRQSSSINNNKLIRHKSCENILHNNNKSITNIPSKTSMKIIPTNLFSTKKSDIDNNDENTTVTDGSKFEWEYLSDTIDHSKKSFKKISPSPIIIRERIKDLFIQQNIDIRFLRPPTPIIVREVLPKPSSSIQHCQSSKPPITPKRKILYDSIPHKRHADEQSKQIMIEYDQINVTLDNNIKQQKDIKCINPIQYTQQYGSTLYSNKVFQNFLTNII